MFKGVYNNGEGISQILILGPSNSVVPGWTTIETSMEPSTSFHYEEVVRGTIQFGIWDVSGALQRLWPLFYRMIALDGLVFVVSVFDSDFRTPREWIRRLINEDELRMTQIVIVINIFDQSTEEVTPMVDALTTGLGLEELKSLTDNPDRFRWIVANAKEGENDSEWKSVIYQFVQSMQKMRFGAEK
ncbi:uncharacterized protein LOC129617864 [Condylostylus longicornis]|uniref:uncharacterized protein LOC129617864 n=1 Tax=Condylostylus longicornis TaxID=2530218 RepID=UPI00244E3348|nr:uncharacterized protein LOC129617864 [Condylostylus longicornis]